VSDWIHDYAAHRVPEHLERVLSETSLRRQRSPWSSLERWLPMQTTLRLAPVPRAAWLLVVLVLLVLAVATAAVYVGSRPHLLAPFGIAANGTLVYGGRDGDIYTFDEVTGVSTALITGGTVDGSPAFSPDGSRFAFTRGANGGGQEIWVADADGTDPRRLSGAMYPLEGAWSPDGTRLAISQPGSDALVIVHLDGTLPQVLDLGLLPQNFMWRPDGRELVFRGTTTPPDLLSFGLYRVAVAGGEPQAIRPPSYWESDWQVPALSPDGTRIVYSRWDNDDVEGGSLYVADVESGSEERLIFDESSWSEYHAQWSPDGQRLVFNRGRPQESYHLAVGSASGGRLVDLGPEQSWEAGAIAAFSPDGTKVIARLERGSIWMFDAAGGSGRDLGINIREGPSWQRLAP